MLKQKIDKTAFDALPDVMKAEYKANPTNAAEYLLDTEEAREAIAARDREKTRADSLQTQIDGINTQLAEAKAAKTTAEEDAARKKGDVTTLEASWKTKLDEAKAASDKTIEALKAKLGAVLVTKEAERIAAMISTVPSLLAGAIAKRLKAEIDVDVPFTRVLDASGAPTAFTVDDLSKEFVANPEYKSIIKANGASGGGAGGGSGGGGAGNGGDNGGGAAGKKLSELSEPDRVRLYRTNRPEYDRLLAEQQAGAR